MNLIHFPWNSLHRCWPYSLEAALAVFAAQPPKALAGDERWTVSTVEGSAMVIDAEHGAREVQPDLPLGAGTTIATGEDGMITLDREADNIVIFPSSASPSRPPRRLGRRTSCRISDSFCTGCNRANPGISKWAPISGGDREGHHLRRDHGTVTGDGFRHRGDGPGRRGARRAQRYGRRRQAGDRDCARR